MSSRFRSVFTSYQSEERLIERRDTDALWIRYRKELPGGDETRLNSLVNAMYRHHTGNIAVYKPVKYLGNVMVHGNQETPADGQERPPRGHPDYNRGWSDDPTLARIHRNTRQNMLHVGQADSFGPDSLRRSLHDAAQYISLHDRLREREYVVGVTYREIAAVALRFGFREAWLDSSVRESYSLSAEAEHRVFNALNPSDKPRVYQPAMVFLPTDEFIKTFTLPDQPAG